jgi:hypothetical protein
LKISPSKEEGLISDLAAIGVSHKESSNAQFLADLPEPVFYRFRALVGR